MTLLRNIILTALLLAMALLLLPVLLLLAAVTAWRLASVLEKFRVQQPIEGEFYRRAEPTVIPLCVQGRARFD